MFTPDGRYVVTRSEDGSARVWRPAVDPILSLVGRHTAAGRAVAVASDGRIASVALDGTLRVWRRDGRSVRVIPQPAEAVDVAFSRDGSLLVTAGGDGVARVWGADDGRLRQSFTHGAPLTSAAFDRDATRVVTGGSDGMARVFERAGGAPLAAPARHRRRHRRHVQPGRPLRRDGRRQRRGAGLADGIREARRQAGRPAQGRFDGNRLQPKRQADRDGEPRRGCASLERVRPDLAPRSARPLGRCQRRRLQPRRALGRDGRPHHGRDVEDRDRSSNQQGHARALPARARAARRSVAFFPDSRRVASIGDDGTVRTYLCELCGTAPQLAVRARRLLDRLGSNLTPAERTRYIGG